MSDEPEVDGAGREVVAQFGDNWRLVKSNSYNANLGFELHLTHDANAHQSYTTPAFSWDTLREIAEFAMNEQA